MTDASTPSASVIPNLSTLGADASKVEAAVVSEAKSAVAEVGFIRANWGKLSAAFIALGVVAFLLRGCF